MNAQKILIQLEDLSVYTADGIVLVEPISLSIKQGQNLTILGETGSGKSLLAQAIMGALPDNLVVQGKIMIHDKTLHTGKGKLDKTKFQTLWGRDLTMLPQEPVRSLDPTMTTFRQIWEGAYLVKKTDNPTATRMTLDTLETLSLSHAKDYYPHELSGGMAQRTSFAAATISGAYMVIADEPTKGLDYHNKLSVIHLLSQVANPVAPSETEQAGCLLTITHDIEVATRLSRQGDLLMVMKKGQLLEQGEALDVLKNPTSDYAKALINANPATWVKDSVIHADTPLLSLHDVAISRGKKQLFSGLTLTLHQGQAIGLIGDSGIGKSSLGDALCGLIQPSQGRLTWHTQPKRHQVLKLYQDPPAAFAPHITLGTLINDVIRRHRLDGTRIHPLMEALQLHPELLNRTSESVSGGELQRIAIMRALLMKPVLLFADEVTNRLDPITQKTTLDLLTKACRQENCALVMVSHDHDLTRHYCDMVVDLADYTDYKS